jgi:hypothetical protein
MNRAGSILNSRDRAFARKRKRHLGLAYAFRREFMAAHDLGDVIRVVRTTQYKVLGIPMAKRVAFNNGKTNLYLFGINILRTKDVRV